MEGIEGAEGEEEEESEEEEEEDMMEMLGFSGFNTTKVMFCLSISRFIICYPAGRYALMGKVVLSRFFYHASSTVL